MRKPIAPKLPKHPEQSIRVIQTIDFEEGLTLQQFLNQLVEDGHTDFNQLVIKEIGNYDSYAVLEKQEIVENKEYEKEVKIYKTKYQSYLEAMKVYNSQMELWKAEQGEKEEDDDRKQYEKLKEKFQNKI